MQEKLSASTVAVQGSGWGWLGYNKAAGKLAIATCANQVRRNSFYIRNNTSLYQLANADQNTRVLYIR